MTEFMLADGMKFVSVVFQSIQINIDRTFEELAVSAFGSGPT